MIKKLYIAISFTIVFASTSIAQAQEGNMYFKTTFDQTKLQALMEHISGEVKRGNLEPFELNTVLDGKAINSLASLDIKALQKDAMQPYMDQMCAIMIQEEPNLDKAAQLFAAAWEAEANATTAAYDNLRAQLSDKAYLAIETFRENNFPQGNKQDLDWEQFALRDPTNALMIFSRACEKFNDPAFSGNVPTDDLSNEEQFMNRSSGSSIQEQ